MRASKKATTQSRRKLIKSLQSNAYKPFQPASTGTKFNKDLVVELTINSMRTKNSLERVKKETEPFVQAENINDNNLVPVGESPEMQSVPNSVDKSELASFDVVKTGL